MNERDDIPPLPEPWPGGTRLERGAEGDHGERPGETARPTAPIPSSGGASGCGKPILFGCGCLALGAVLLLILLVAMSGRLVDWFLDTAEQTIMTALPDEVDEVEREQLESSFAAFRRGVSDGTLNTRGLTQLQVELTNAYSRAQRGLLEKVDIERLLAAFEQVLGPEPEPAPASPAEIPIADGPARPHPWVVAAQPSAMSLPWSR